MSDFELVDEGGGKFSLKGRMTFDTVTEILRQSEEPFSEHTRIEVSLAGVTEADSAGLALLLEWITWANHTVREISFTDIPERIKAIARVTEVDNLLTRGERWAGFIQAPGSAETAARER
ncbi:MAG TPA: STAS domain-containing protein [Woeseiaceae bacterium]|nr:STAS domain-containing protein [Woeseiaceae bacterium]